MASYGTATATLNAALAEVNTALAAIQSGSSIGEYLQLIERRAYIEQALATGGSGGGGDASAENQTAIQANAGSDASKAVAVQGITGGTPIPIADMELAIDFLEAISNASILGDYDVFPNSMGSSAATNIKMSAGSFRAVKVENKNAAIRYFLLINTNDIPDVGDPILDVISLPPNSVVIIGSDFYGRKGLVCTVGVSWAFSTEPDAIALGDPADCFAIVGYK